MLCLGSDHIVLDGDPAPPPPKGHSLPQFSAHIRCGQMAACIKMSLNVELGLSPGDFVVDGDTALPPKGGRAPSPICGPFLLWQTAGYIKMPLGKDVGLNPGDFVLDGGPILLPKKGGGSPKKYRPMFIVAKRQKTTGQKYNGPPIT